jgi:hypothetical protein
MAKVSFGGGAEVETVASARATVESLAQVAGGQRATDQGQPLPIGYVALHTDHGPVYVNASQVAWVRAEGSGGGAKAARRLRRLRWRRGSVAAAEPSAGEEPELVEEEPLRDPREDRGVDPHP